MKLKEIVSFSEKLKEISSINEKIDFLTNFFKKLKEDEFKIAISLLIGENPYEKPYIGFKSLRNLFVLKEGNESVEILEIDEILKRLKEIKGHESQKRKLNIIYNLFKKINNKEREFFALFLTGEIRHGASKGVFKKAIAKFLKIKEEEIDEAILKSGNFIETVESIFRKGKEFLKEKKFELFKPFSPMLAEIVSSIDEIPYGQYAVEYKIDGIRIQVHKKDKDIKIFSRNLKEITDNLFEIKEILGDIKGEFVLDGEAAIFDKENKIIPFQDMMSIISRKNREMIPSIRPFFFDIIYKDGEEFFEMPNRKRWEILKNTIPEEFLIKRIETDKKEEIERFFNKSIEEGNEGVMIKKLDSPYFIGSRKKYWLKLKNFYTLDLVIIEAEWGHGRRKGWLSDFLLGCLDEKGERFLPLGKTFKGLTDEEFKEITEVLISKKIKDKEWGIIVKPEIVVEVDFSEIEESPFYESGYALRFARIRNIRYDKSPYEIAKIDEVKKIFEEFRKRKGKFDERNF